MFSQSAGQVLVPCYGGHGPGALGEAARGAVCKAVFSHATHHDVRVMMGAPLEPYNSDQGRVGVGDDAAGMWGLAAPATAKRFGIPAITALLRLRRWREAPLQRSHRLGATALDCIGPADAAGGGMSESTLATDNYNIRSEFKPLLQCEHKDARACGSYPPTPPRTGYNLGNRL